VPRPDVTTPEDIAAALALRALPAWSDLTRSLPAKVQDALAEAAARFAPKARPVTLPSPGLLEDAAAVDHWLDQVRAALREALTQGPVLPRL
jgi:hypothetical protein